MSDVFVSRHPEELAAARALAERRRQAELACLLEHPAWIDYVGSHRHALVKNAGRAAAEQLIALAGDASRQPMDRFSAVSALIKLDDPSAGPLLGRLLPELGDAWAQEVLWSLDFAIDHADTTEARRVRQLPALRTWVRRQFHHPDASVRNDALSCCQVMGISVTDADLPPADSNAADPDGRMAYWHAQLAPTPALFRIILDRLEAKPPQEAVTWLWAALSELPPAEDAALAARALRLATAYLRTPALGLNTGRRAAIDVAKKHGDTAAGRGALGDVITADMAPEIVRFAAVEALAERDPAAALERATAMYRDDPSARAAAAKLIGRLARGSADPALVQRLTHPVPDALNPRALAAVVQALLDIGGPDAESAAFALARHLDDDLARPALWQRTGMTPQRAVRQLAELGVVTPEQAERGLAHYLIQSGEYGHGRADFVSTFFRGAGVWFTFDTEASCVPPRYDHLLLDFAKAGGGYFQPEAIVQEYVDWENQRRRPDDQPPARFRVQFIHDGRLYRFTVRYNGDWFDVPPLYAAIDAALSDAAAPVRFIPLTTRDQGQAFVLAPPAAFAAAVAELKLPLSDDLAAAAHQGMDFEQYVRDVFKTAN